MSTKTVKLLVCSGNLGNAEPDVSSLEAWVPEDGLCHQVLENQKYPVVSKQAEFGFKGNKKNQEEDPPKGDGDDDKYKEDEEAARKLEKFDLIVLGMQESTFEPVDDEILEEIKAKLDGNERDALTKSDDDESDNESDEESREESESEIESEDESESESESESEDEKADDNDGSKEKKDIKKKSDSLSRITKQVSKQTKKATKKVTKKAGRATKVAGKATKKVAKTAVKGTKKAAKAGTKIAMSSAEQATKLAAKGADKAEKAARQGASAVNTLTASRDNTRSVAEIIADGTAVLHELLEQRLPSYTRILSYQRGEMRLLVFSLNKHHSVQIKSTRAQNTGMAGLANKGGIVSEVIVDRGTVFSFMTCHLEAHEGLDKYARRCSTLGDILKGTKKTAVPSIYPDASLSTHFCFVLGDLNFRTRYKGRIKYDEQIDDVNILVRTKNWKDLNHYDELRMALEKQECLAGFKTLQCNFPPTFKVERGDGYVYKENRTPSYTDRILWRTGDLLQGMLTPLAYEPIDTYTTSDHKPIRGAFEVRLNQGVHLRKKQEIRNGTFAWKDPEEKAKNENVHLTVNDIQADIQAENSDGSAVDSYVCLVSSPEDILLKKPTKFKQAYSAMKKFLNVTESFAGIDIDTADSAKNGWPRTQVMAKNQNPEWSKEELNCHLKPIRKDGFPINLTGAILHIFVFKYNSRQTDEVIGSYPVNLECIFRRCTNYGIDDEDADRRKIIGREHKNTITVPIDGPLLKNGKQTGRIRCTIDAWMVENALLASAGGGSLDLTQNDAANTANSENA